MRVTLAQMCVVWSMVDMMTVAYRVNVVTTG
jgi:hypothetical protein